ncbi:hypothetical protein HPB50_007913 [Hyalomma asiaticum]|uniref:Uncharacterized protein n=1 Tax=Hyalomma asiaticum TaxID=266040 RepID=A0ACB7TCU6_HYAAI|nr:hypothetical protein HPB50_007913 [Hyalomma asiaticum]
MGISFWRKRGPAQQVRPVGEVAPFMTLDGILAYSERPLRCVVEQLSDALKSGNPGEPRTIFRHDMDGNYKEDRFIHGSDQANVYRFHHWQKIDTFTYYSHHVVRTPPPGWTFAAHLHGVAFPGVRWRLSAGLSWRELHFEDTYGHTRDGLDVATILKAGNAAEQDVVYMGVVFGLREGGNYTVTREITRRPDEDVDRPTIRSAARYTKLNVFILRIYQIQRFTTELDFIAEYRRK